ncbi:FAD-dependent oxidoreductase [Amycolatopsis sp. WAC 01375]|uniref:NAD(P)/FAD-dependent oxidoreductase n=1 Tax=unclassified Amycolatopsis TaxID=2618356 RepID=UPI000F783217|nr:MULTISPECIES: NAD(P)/FAD-dependent oxidoreductase [unclassified Amycolatopsis]RSM72451.1 FAD-dependent oxidoreductase [Amycolatopsis sp. WAC 01375]RSN34466.1 FAD-dependent oxidoreductase [Amycolatopsis sp. WAC 01416]
MRVVIIGGGFAGYNAAKTLLKSVGDDTEIVVLNPTDYFLYLPLLPEVAAGILEPRRISVSIPGTLRGVRLVLGTARSVDFDGRSVSYVDPEDREHSLGYDRLVLAAGSVNKLLPIPGVPEYAHGFRGLPEALYLRDHITRQIELAASAQDPAERDARCTFVVVGAGYTGTEVAAQGPAFTAALAARHPELKDQKIRWLLLDLAERVLPELDRRLGDTADEVLRERDVEVLMKTSIDNAGENGVTLTSGESVPTHTLVWCVGVRPDPLIEDLGLKTAKGRLVVTAQLNVPGRRDVYACGDAAAVPDLTRPGEYTAMTAQHAERQGKLAGRNVAASLGHGSHGTYRHHDLGFVVDLGARQAAANPLHIPLSGFAAKAVTRGYHLLAMPGNRLRTATDWALEAVTKRQTVQLGLVRSGSVPLDTDSPELPRTNC